MTGEDQDYKDLIRRAVRDEGAFLRLTLSGPPESGRARGPRKVTVRPVAVRGERMMQFTCFTESGAEAKNCAGRDVEQRLDEVLAMPFRHVNVQSADGDIHVRITRKGKALVSSGKASQPAGEPELAHDRRKDHPLPADRPDPFLQAVGVMSEDGHVRPAMWGKFRQIGEFLRVIDQTVAKQHWARGRNPLRILDGGCGKAYLTFAAYHYLSDVCGLPVHVVGVDQKADLVNGATALQRELGWDGLEFRLDSIRDFRPAGPPDVVLSLHACDTATDEAIAQGVRWGARVILAAPCCQHELHRQLRSPLFHPLTRHGILRERLADLLTDAFRALALRIMGYRTSVIEFVDPEATAKNLMIRAAKARGPGDPGPVGEYCDLKEFWQVTPCIEELLGEEFGHIVEAGRHGGRR